MYYPKHHQVFPKPQTMKTTLDHAVEAVNKHRADHGDIPNGMASIVVRPELQFQLLHPDSKLPTRATDGSAGLDLYCHSSNPYGKSMVEYDTGVAVAIPEGYVGLVVPRSSISGTNMRLANCVGVIDSDFRGEIRLRFDVLNYPDSAIDYDVGDKIGQLVIVPAPQFSPVAVDELPATGRGNGSFGSSGR